MKHTPAPWFIRYCDDDYNQCMTVISSKDYGPSNTSQFNDEEDTIAIVYHQLCPVVGMQEENDANVSLISAAPDLLACCEEIREAIAYFSEYDLPLGWEERIDAAIKKAKGEK